MKSVATAIRRSLMPVLRQNLDNLKGEIAFRSKLARQHTTGELLLPDYFSKDAHDAILAERINTTRSAFELKKQAGEDFSRFVELGAERGHRSLALVNFFGAEGIAMDLSFDQLRTMPHFSSLFQLPGVPLRVCCDANNLPLRSDAVPFLFCYQFLHHFPSLGEIIREIHRVLSPGGEFFFDEEPMGRVLQLYLYKQRTKEYSHFNLRKGKLLRWLESFVSETASDEVEHGVIENHTMKMPHWRESLAVFDSTKVCVRTLRYIRSQMTSRMRLENWLNHLLGGVIYGACHKKTEASQICADLTEKRPPLAWLGCPACRIKPTGAMTFDHPSLDCRGDRLVCSENGCSYPIVEEIPILIPESLRKALYPQFG